MENRHEDLASQVRNLAASVQRVEQGLDHAEKLNELRFNAQTQAVGALDSKLTLFVNRIEGIIEGTIETAQTRQGKQMMEDYFAWRKATDLSIDSLQAEQLRSSARSAGISSVLTGTRGVILLVCSILSPLIAAIAIIVSRAPGFGQ